jgi:hypothetical protein
MNPNILMFALAAIGRLEALMQNAETQYNSVLQQLQEKTAECDALKAALEKLKKGA